MRVDLAACFLSGIRSSAESAAISPTIHIRSNPRPYHAPASVLVISDPAPNAGVQLSAAPALADEAECLASPGPTILGRKHSPMIRMGSTMEPPFCC